MAVQQKSTYSITSLAVAKNGEAERPRGLQIDDHQVFRGANAQSFAIISRLRWPHYQERQNVAVNIKMAAVSVRRTTVGTTALLLDDAGLGRVLEIIARRNEGTTCNEDGDLRP
jgi:hypothetical protein